MSLLETMHAGFSSLAGGGGDPMTKTPKAPTQNDLRDAAFSVSANAAMFGLGLLALTDHRRWVFDAHGDMQSVPDRRAGFALLKTAIAAGVVGVVIAVIPPEGKG